MHLKSGYKYTRVRYNCEQMNFELKLKLRTLIYIIEFDIIKWDWNMHMLITKFILILIPPPLAFYKTMPAIHLLIGSSRLFHSVINWSNASNCNSSLRILHWTLCSVEGLHLDIIKIPFYFEALFRLFRMEKNQLTNYCRRHQWVKVVAYFFSSPNKVVDRRSSIR